MKLRYVIENDGDGTYSLSEATPSDPSYSFGASFDSVDEAKRIAEQSAPEPLTWKPGPEAWGTDVICVSQYFDDGVEPNRDR